MSDDDQASAMYRQDILDHYRNPENFGTLDPHTLSHQGENPLCGDQLEVALRLSDADAVEVAMFQGQGCAISQAATDILLCHIRDRPVDEVLSMDEGAMMGLLGIDVSPLRMKCALLGLLIVQDGLRIHRGEMAPKDVSRIGE